MQSNTSALEASTSKQKLSISEDERPFLFEALLRYHRRISDNRSQFKNPDTYLTDLSTVLCYIEPYLFNPDPLIVSLTPTQLMISRIAIRNLGLSVRQIKDRFYRQIFSETLNIILGKIVDSLGLRGYYQAHI